MRIYFLFLAYLLFIAFEGSTEEAPADPLLLTTVLVIEGKVFLESDLVDRLLRYPDSKKVAQKN